MPVDHSNLPEKPLAEALPYTSRSPLYHYTSLSGLQGIVASKSMWCSQIQYLNDTGELRHGLDILASVCSSHFDGHPLFADLKDRTLGFRSVNVFICSLSEAGDLLSQWRGYSGNSGVALCFSKTRLAEKARQNGFHLAKCVYGHGEKVEMVKSFLAGEIEIAEIKGALTHIDLIISRFLPIAAQFKHPSFAEEREWRLISSPVPTFDGRLKVRATAGGLVPYFVFDLRTGKQPLLTKLQAWRTNEDICVDQVVMSPGLGYLESSAVGTLFETEKAYLSQVSLSQIPFKSI